MLDNAKLKALRAAVRDYLVGLVFGGADLDEATARKFGEAHGLGSKSGGRLVYAATAFTLDHVGGDLVALQADLLGALAGRTGDEVIQ